MVQEGNDVRVHMACRLWENSLFRFLLLIILFRLFSSSLGVLFRVSLGRSLSSLATFGLDLLFEILFANAFALLLH